MIRFSGDSHVMCVSVCCEYCLGDTELWELENSHIDESYFLGSKTKRENDDDDGDDNQIE